MFQSIRVFFSVVFCFVFITSISAVEINEDEVRSLVQQNKITRIQQFGREVLPVLVNLYKSSDENQRAAIAQTFYNLGWKYPDAARVMMEDIETPHQGLRLQVQWALGRVSDDVEVVEALLKNLQFDSNQLFRDKAACALAYDQIHLNEKQKVRLFEGLIQALSDPKDDVRRIAITALQIHTGQNKGFNPAASEDNREQKIKVWEAWLEEYKSNL